MPDPNPAFQNYSQTGRSRLVLTSMLHYSVRHLIALELHGEAAKEFQKVVYRLIDILFMFRLTFFFSSIEETLNIVEKFT